MPFLGGVIYLVYLIGIGFSDVTQVSEFNSSVSP
jgi:hypothetical protein